jgi:outer membrane protein
MTKELQIEGEKMLELKKRELDSLKLLLKSELIKEKSSLLMQHYLVKRQEIDEYQVTFVKYNTEKIWDRISTYTTDFAMLNDYDMIIDADEKKSILYGDKEHDVTLDLLKYINMKYEGYQ